MTQDEVIALAREAGVDELPDVPAAYKSDWFSCTAEELTRFAALIEAKVKADLLAGAGEPVAYGIYDVYGKLQDTKPIEAEWKGDAGALGTYWGGNEPLHTADQVAAEVLRGKQDAERQIAEALRQHGLTLVKVASGYEVMRLEQIAAHDIGDKI